MSELKVRKSVLGLLMALIVLVACQPQVVLVDVTRVVEVAPSNAAGGQNGLPATGQPVEVTRLVSQEITRVVTQTVVEERVIAVPSPVLGSSQRPVQLLFTPVVDVDTVSRRAQALAERLASATGLQYAVGIMDDEENQIQLMCAAPADTVGFLTAAGYALASQRCGVQIGNVALREDGLSWQTGMIVARRDSGITTLADLAGRRWAVPDADSLSRSLFFQALLVEAGVEVAEMVEVPGDSSAMLAVYDREADFATAAYVPPILPFEERPWTFGEDSPEIWRRVGLSPQRSPIGYVLVNGEPQFGGYRLRDARSRVFDITPGIYDETFILQLSDPIPNDTVAFGSDFPLGIAREVIGLLVEVAGSEACVDSVCSADFLGWTGAELAVDETYAPLRFVIDTLQLTSTAGLTP